MPRAELDPINLLRDVHGTLRHHRIALAHQVERGALGKIRDDAGRDHRHSGILGGNIIEHRADAHVALAARHELVALEQQPELQAAGIQQGVEVDQPDEGKDHHRRMRQPHRPAAQIDVRQLVR